MRYNKRVDQPLEVYHDAAICFRLLRQLDDLAVARALFRAGSSIEARIAMIAITTRSSINVKFTLFMDSPSFFWLGWMRKIT